MFQSRLQGMNTDSFQPAGEARIIKADDIYCCCDIYVEIPNSKQATHFVLKYPQAKQMEK